MFIPQIKVLKALLYVTHPHMNKMAVIVNDLRPGGKERKIAGWLERGGTGGGEGG
jgi:hypothetical protein